MAVSPGTRGGDSIVLEGALVVEESRESKGEPSEYLVRLRLLTHNLRLIQTRNEKGLSQSQLALLTDLSVHTVSQIEQLKQVPTVEQAQEIADALGVEPEWLFPPELVALKDVRREALLTGEQIAKLQWIRPLSLPELDVSLLRQQLEQAAKDVLLSLTPRERRVIQLRFGLDNGQSRSLEETGKEFGLTRERVRQIEAKALRKLRHPRLNRRLKDYLDLI